MKKRIGIYGVTGSVGRQGAEVVKLNQELFDVVFVTAHSSEKELNEYKETLDAKYSFLTSTFNGQEDFKSILKNETPDLILHAASGVCAIESVYNIAISGADIALANKESIVTAGNIIKEAAEKSGSKILPVDSEHSAVFQCLRGNNKKNVEKIVLTASGGPFRNLPAKDLIYVLPQDALNHPKWHMGKKISIDSATMMNKGLELIEAKYLFDVDADKLGVIIHPESIIHSYVVFSDGAIISQMGKPNMKLPIAYALGFPERIKTGETAPDMSSISTLTFENPDLNKFKCLDIAIKVLKSNSNALMTLMNASNEAAVMSFLNNEIKFTDIAPVVEEAVETCNLKNAYEIEQAIENNALAMKTAKKIITKYTL